MKINHTVLAVMLTGTLFVIPFWAVAAPGGTTTPKVVGVVLPTQEELTNTNHKTMVGPQKTAVINNIVFTGNHLFKSSELLQFIQSRQGDSIDYAVIGRDMEAINQQYNTAGYILSKVMNANLDKEGTLRFDIHESLVEDVVVQGNTKTKDKVILREMIIRKGMLFNAGLVRRSVERIHNTGFFDDVSVQLLPGQVNPNDVIIVVDVVEQKTATLTFGAGYSNSNGLVGMLGINEINLRGRGDQIGLNWEFGGTTGSKRNYLFYYNHPWMNDRGDSIGFSIFDREYNYDDYDQNGDSVAEYYKRTKGGNITYGRANGPYVKDYFTLETKRTDYTEHRGGYDYSQVPGYLESNFGRTNSLTWTHVFDNRDNVFDPMRGRRLSFAGTMAGHGLGGDFNYYKLMTELRTYRKVGRSQVLALRLMGGIGFGDIPGNDLFTLGGADTLRGYEDDEFRGKRFYEGTLEYRFPIMKKVQGVLFIDAGNAWSGTDSLFWYEGNNKLHYAGGIGVRIKTPIGPVRLDYGRGSEGGKFNFSFGGQF